MRDQPLKIQPPVEVPGAELAAQASDTAKKKGAGKDAQFTLRVMAERMARLEMKVDALLRQQLVDPSDVPYPERLLLPRVPFLSQNTEDGITYGLLREAGIATHKFVEIGSGPNGGNTGFLARDLGFSGVFIDQGGKSTRIATALFASPKVTIARERVTVENINDLITENGMSGEIDVLSIDIDGYDLWIWQAITECAPRVVIVEFNPSFGVDRAVTVPYDPEFQRDDLPRSTLRGRYFGASLPAFVNVAAEKGYRLVCIEPLGVNAFFLRNDLAEHIPAFDPADAPVHRKDLNLTIRGFDLYAAITAAGLSLVDVPEAGA